MLEVVKCSLLFDREDVAVPVEETVVEGVDRFEGLYELNELVFSYDAHVHATESRGNLIVSVSHRSERRLRC